MCSFKKWCLLSPFYIGFPIELRDVDKILASKISTISRLAIELWPHSRISIWTSIFHKYIYIYIYAFHVYATDHIFVFCPWASSLPTSLVISVLDWLSQLVQVTIRSYAMLQLFNENVIFYLQNSSSDYWICSNLVEMKNFSYKNICYVGIDFHIQVGNF